MYGRVFCSLLVLLSLSLVGGEQAAATATVVVCHTTSTTCQSCVEDGVGGACHWCPTSNGCFSDSSPLGCFSSGGIKQVDSCPGGDVCQAQQQQTGCTNASASNAWLNAPVSDESMCVFPPSVRGCTDAMASNYLPSATVDDGKCVFPNANLPSTPTQVVCNASHPQHQQQIWGRTWSDECVCSSGGMDHPYGAFCGKSYTGCPGRQPCDGVDACCQVYDHCANLDPSPTLPCSCIRSLLACINQVSRTDCGFCGRMQEARNSLLNELTALDAVCFPPAASSPSDSSGDKSDSNGGSDIGSVSSATTFGSLLWSFFMSIIWLCILLAFAAGMVVALLRYHNIRVPTIESVADVQAFVRTVMRRRSDHNNPDFDYEPLGLDQSTYEAMPPSATYAA